MKHLKNVIASLALLALLPTGAFGQTRRTPERYEAVSTVIMQYRWFKFPLLGVISVDTRKNSFALAGMSQLGLKVFEVREENGKVQSRIPEAILQRNPKIGDSIAADVHRMFLDLVPAPCAKAHVRGNEKVFTEDSKEGILELTYDSTTGQLTRKRFLKTSALVPWNSTEWLVTYGPYVTAGPLTYPKTVSLKNRALNYRITTIVKQIHPRRENR